MPIRGLTDRERFPRVGKIHLGEKVKTMRNGREVEYPRATEYFKCPPEVQDVYGEKPTVLEPVYIPAEDEDVYASAYYRYYTQTFDLTCKGDGNTAMRKVDIERAERSGEPVPVSRDTRKPKGFNDEVWEWREVACPCPLLDQRQCRASMFLQIILPNVASDQIGVWQIDTGSVISTDNVYSFLRSVKAAFGRVSGIPLKLELVPHDVTPRGQSKKSVRVLKMSFTQDFTVRQLQEAIRDFSPWADLQIAPPDDTSRPALIAPTKEERMAADEIPDKFKNLLDKEPPANLTLAKFEGAMLGLGWDWNFVWDKLALPIDHNDMDISDAIQAFIDLPDSDYSWAKAWSDLRRKVTSTGDEEPAPTDPQAVLFPEDGE